MATKEISRFDLEWMLKAIEETHQKLVKANKELDKAFYNRNENFNPYAHIGSLGAQLIITEIRLRSILEVTEKK